MFKRITTKLKTQSRFFWLTTILLLSLFVCRALLTPGYFTTHDGDFHIARSFHLIAELERGQFPVRIAQDAAFGYGYPIFSYFYPLPYYIVACFHFLGVAVTESWKLLLFLSVFFAGIFYFNWLKCFFYPATALIATAVFLLAPFQFLSLFVTGQIGATLSLCFVPLILLSVTKLLRSKHQWAGIGLAVGIAGLVTSHILSAVMFFPFLVLFAVCLFLSESQKIKNHKKLLITLCFWVLLGVGLSSFYLLPLLVQKNAVRLATVQGVTVTEHFVELKQLLYSKWGYGYSGLSPENPASYQIGLSIILGFSVSLFIFLKKLLARKNIRTQQLLLPTALLLVFLSSVFLMTKHSTPLWLITPLAGYLQYPWRLLALSIVAGGWLVAWSLKHSNSRLLGVGFCLLAAINSRNYAQPAAPVRYHDTDFLSWQGLMYGSSDISWELLPPGSSIPTERTTLFSSDHTSLDSSITLLKEERLGTKRVFEIKTTKEQELIFNLLYYPEWSVLVNGIKTATTQAESGRLSITAPSGESTIVLSLQKTPSERGGDILSAASGVIVLLVIVKNFSQRFHKK